MWDGTENRKEANAVNRLLYGKIKVVEKLLRDVWTEVRLTNGKVKLNRSDIDENTEKLDAIEKTEVFEDGYRKGKKSMKTSTRNALILGLIILSTGIAVATFGIREIRSYKTDEIDVLKSQLFHKSNQIESIEQYFRTHKEPLTEGDMTERLKQLLKDNH